MFYPITSSDKDVSFEIRDQSILVVNSFTARGDDNGLLTLYINFFLIDSLLKKQQTTNVV